MSSESTAPDGKKVYFEAGKAFYYDRGSRVYLNDPELVRQAEAVFKLKCERLDVCLGCGTWRKFRQTSNGFNEPTPEGHDRQFFWAFHRRQCGDRMEHSNALEFQSLPVEKHWRPESCRDYVPFTAAFVRHSSELEMRLLGNWDNPGYNVRECFTFCEQGHGRYLNWMGLDPDEVEFTWQIRAGEFLLFDLSDARPALATRLAPPGGIHFEVVTYTSPYGEPKTNLRLLFPQQQHPFVFERAEPERPWPAVESERVGSGLEVETHRLRPEYITKLLRVGAEFRGRLFGQIRTIEKSPVVNGTLCTCSRSPSIDELLAQSAADLDTTDWAMADRLFRVLRHLELRSGIRLAALYPRNADFGGRLVGVDAEYASVLERTSLRLSSLSSGIQPEEPPETVPSWVHWSPSRCVTMDGTPASRFELCLLRNWTTELFSFHCLYADGIIVGQDAIFGANIIRVPEAVVLSGDLRPLVAVVHGQTRESSLLPSKPEGIERTGHGSFALIEWYSAHQLSNPCHWPRGITSIGFNREWYRGTQLLWNERELLWSDDRPW